MSHLDEDRRKESIDDHQERGPLILHMIKGWRSVNWIIVMLGRISAVLIIAIMMITVVDVILRYFLRAPLRGSYEMSEIFFLSSVFLGAAYTHSFRAHVNVELLVSHLSSKVNLILETCMFLIALAIYVLFTWQGTEAFLKSLGTGEYRWGLIQIPLWPARLMIPVGVCVLCLRFIGEILINLNKLFGHKKGKP